MSKSSIARLLNGLSVAARLRSGFGFLMLLVVAMALSGGAAMLSMTRQMNQIVDVNNARKDVANDLVEVINGLSVQTRSIILLTDPDQINREMAQFEKSLTLHDQIQGKLIAALSQETGGSPARTLMDEIVAAGSKTLPSIKKAVKAGFDGANVEATEILTKRVQKDETRWRAKVQAMLQLQREQTATAVEVARSARTRAMMLGALLLLVALVSGGLVASWVVRNNVQMMAVIAEQNASLERRVTERTAQLQTKTNDINAMLQNMALGVCTVVPGNRIHAEYSNYLRSFSRMDDLANTELLGSVLGRAVMGEDVRDQVATVLSSALGEDTMMFDFNEHLLPREIMLLDPDGLRRIAQLHWSPIVGPLGTTEKVLLIIQDVTSLRALELEASQQREELAAMSKVLKVPQGKFNEFIASAQRLTTESRQIIKSSALRSDAVITHLFRNLHTVKGNARTFDFNLVAEPAHAAEGTYDRLRKSADAPWHPAELLDELNLVTAGIDAYAELNEKLGRGGRSADFVTGRGAFIALEDLTEIKDTVAHLLADSREPQAMRLQALVGAIGLAKLSRIASGAMDAAAAVASLLGKPVPTLELIGGACGFTPEFAEALKSALVHIVRNSMDHGIESPEFRVAADKPAQGTLTMQCLRHERHMELTIRDDGRGLHLARLTEKGRASGLIAAGTEPRPEAVAELIFHSGLSTAEELTDVSGRGVGMDAVRTFLQEAGAGIDIRLDDLPAEADHVRFTLVIRIPASACSMSTPSAEDHEESEHGRQAA